MILIFGPTCADTSMITASRVFKSLHPLLYGVTVECGMLPKGLADNAENQRNRFHWQILDP
jgi:hypothetical protein